MIIAQIITWILAVICASLTLKFFATLLDYKSLKEFYKQYDTDFSKSYFIVLSAFMVLIYFVFFAAIYNTYIRTPTNTPKNKYPDKRYERVIDSLMYQNDSLHNELEIFIEGCDHKEQIYEQIIFDLQHKRPRKLVKKEIKDSL